MEIKPIKVLFPHETESTSTLDKSSWRTLTPFYDVKASACKTECPLYNNIPHWINLVKTGELKEAYEELKKNNPFPAIYGTICHHPCEEKCLRGQFDENIGIRDIERFIGVYGLEHFDYKLESKIARKEKVAIVAAGPAGLSCAWHLAKEGHKVTIFEAADQPGGMLFLAIPEFRLAGELIKKEIMPLTQCQNLTIRLNQPVYHCFIASIQKDFQATFIAVGAHRSKKFNVSGSDSTKIGIISGLSFLKNSKLSFLKPGGTQINSIAIIGGGNTAVDSARSAKKMYPKSEVTIFYRRTEKEMPAAKEEINEAKKEGILFAFLLSPLRVNENGLVLQQMTLGEKDETGRCRPVPTERLIFIKTDKIITAIGEERGNSFLNPVLFENQEEEGIFIGGDALYGPGFVSKAIASGKEASLKIRRYLGENINTNALPSSAAPPKIIELKDLNLEYFEQQRKNSNPEEEVKRCFSCGLCPQNPEICSNCWKFCPDSAIKIQNNKPDINYDYCKGCLICKHECPRSAIDFREGK